MVAALDSVADLDPIPAWRDGRLMPVGKLRVHREGLRHKAISVFVVDGGQILMQQRAHGKYHTPGLWTNTCCTHPHWGEDDAACAARRLREEMGISGLSLQHMAQIEYRADVGGGLIEHELVQVYLGHARPNLRLAPNPDEVAATRWVSLKALRAEITAAPDKFTPWLRIYLDQHAQQIFAGHLPQQARAPQGRDGSGEGGIAP